MKYFILAFAPHIKLMSDGTVWNITDNKQLEIVEGKVTFTPTENYGKTMKAGVECTVPVAALTKLADTEVDGKTGWIDSVEKKEPTPAQLARKAFNARKKELEGIIEKNAAILADFDAGTPEFDGAKVAIKTARAELATLVPPTVEKVEKVAKVKSQPEIDSEANIEVLFAAMNAAKEAYKLAIDTHNATEGFGKYGSKATGEREKVASFEMTYEIAQAIREFASKNDLSPAAMITAMVEAKVIPSEISTQALNKYLNYRQFRLKRDETNIFIPLNAEYYNCFAEEKVAEIPALAAAHRATGTAITTLWDGKIKTATATA